MQTHWPFVQYAIHAIEQRDIHAKVHVRRRLHYSLPGPHSVSVPEPRIFVQVLTPKTNRHAPHRTLEVAEVGPERIRIAPAVARKGGAQEHSVSLEPLHQKKVQAIA